MSRLGPRWEDCRPCFVLLGCIVQREAFAMSCGPKTHGSFRKEGAACGFVYLESLQQG